MSAAIALFAPAALSFAAAIGALVADARRARAVAVDAASALLVAAGIVAALTPALSLPRTGAVPGTGALAACVYLLGAASLAGGRRRLVVSEGGGQAAALVAFGALSGAVLVTSRDLLMTLVALEGLSLSAYALVAAERTARGTEAAMKYFVQGSVATALLVYGIGLLAALGGGIGFAELRIGLASAPASALAVSAMLVVAGLSFKAGAAPFHAWVPDAYENAPRPLAAFLSSAVKLAVIAATVVLLAGPLSIDPLAERIAAGVTGVAVVSMLFGNVAALRQASLTRMLGYSAVAQAGYAFVGVAFGAPAGPAVLLFALTYALASAAAFIAAESFAEDDSSWDGSVAGLAGAGARSRLAAAALAVSMLSLTGIPLTAGFWGKLGVFSAAVASGEPWLAILGVVLSVLSFGFYGNVIRALYLDPAPRVEAAPDEAGEADVAPMAADSPAAVVRSHAALTAGLLAIAVLGVGVAPLFAGLGGVLQWLLG